MGSVVCRLVRLKGGGKEDIFPLLSGPAIASLYCIESSFHNKTRHVGTTLFIESKLLQEILAYAAEDSENFLSDLGRNIGRVDKREITAVFLWNTLRGLVTISLMRLWRVCFFVA